MGFEPPGWRMSGTRAFPSAGTVLAHGTTRRQFRVVIPKRLESEVKLAESVEVKADAGLPHAPEAFRRELGRRLDLLDREIRALESEQTMTVLADSADSLRRMRKGVNERLADSLDAATWTETRLEIVGMWRRLRREFERLAAASHRRCPARPGQRERGPRW